MRFELDVVGAPRGGYDHRRYQARFGRLDDQMNRLAADRCVACRLDFPSDCVTDQDVTHDLSGLQFYVADLERRADD